MSSVAEKYGIPEALKELGLKVDQVNNGTSTGKQWFSSGEVIESFSPVDGAPIGKIKCTDNEDYQRVIETASAAFQEWRRMPSPQRGEIVRKFND